MNKKDVLGSQSAAGNVQKMKSPPHGLSAGNAHFPTRIPSTLLGNFGADSIPSVLLGYKAGRIIPSSSL